MKLSGSSTPPSLARCCRAGCRPVGRHPIYDIKPYLPYVDSHPEATGGFTTRNTGCELTVQDPENLLASLPPHRAEALRGAGPGPRPSYQHDPERVYGMAFGGYEVKFRVNEKTLTVTALQAK